MAPVLLGRDLRFSRPSLEAEFSREHNAACGADDLRMALFRAPLWIIIAAKLALAGDWLYASKIFLAGEACLLVLLAMRRDNERYIRHYRQPLLVVTVFIQSVLAHWGMELAYTEDESTPGLRKMLMVLTQGNGILFLYLTMFMSWHLWPWMLVQQGMVLAVQLMSNQHMCEVSRALQAAHLLMYSLMPRHLSGLLLDIMQSPVGRQLRAALPAVAAAATVASRDPAAPAPAAAAVCTNGDGGGSSLGEACPGTAVVAASAASTTVAAPLPSLGSLDSVQLCMDIQLLSQLTLGFLLPMLFFWRWEVRRRQAWLRARGRHCFMLGGSFLDYLTFTFPVAWLLWLVHSMLLTPRHMAAI